MIRQAKYLSFLLFVFVLTSCEEGLINNDPENETQLEIRDKILYSKNPNGHNEIYLLDDGKEIKLISNPEYDYWWPKVSPDKQRFLFYRSPVNPDKNHDDYEHAELMITDIDGSSQKVLIPKDRYEWQAQGVCRWNKDGSEILMCAEVKIGAGYQWQLFRTDADGNNPAFLADRWAIDCNFSIDNEHVVFMGFKDNNLTFDLTKLEIQMGKYDRSTNSVSDIVSLTQNTTRDHDPSFSPDNKKIVFSAGNALYTDVDLVLYDLETEEESILLDDSAANGGSMCWSTDGQYVFFHSLHLLRAPFRIKAIDVETKEVVTLLEVEGNDHGFFHPEAF